VEENAGRDAATMRQSLGTSSDRHHALPGPLPDLKARTDRLFGPTTSRGSAEHSLDYLSGGSILLSFGANSTVRC
jgi:hypothetical protein